MMKRLSFPRESLIRLYNIDAVVPSIFLLVALELYYVGQIYYITSVFYHPLFLYFPKITWAYSISI